MGKRQDKIELSDLLERKNFEDLTLLEKQCVLKEISKNEYLQLRLIAVNSQATFSNAESSLDATIKSNLDNAFKKKYNSKSVSSRFIKSEISLWKAAAAFAFLLFACSVFLTKKFPFSSSTEPQIVFKTDTIFKEIPLQAKLAMNDSAAHQLDSQSSFIDLIHFQNVKPVATQKTPPVQKNEKYKAHYQTVALPIEPIRKQSQGTIIQGPNPIGDPDWDEVLQAKPKGRNIEKTDSFSEFNTVIF